MRSDEPTASPAPWYREPWPWLLMAGPAIVVLAGLFTAFLAWRSDDGLVADDYYRRGLAINQTLRREARARELHLQATLTLAGAKARVVLQGGSESPPVLLLWLVHPTRAGQDRQLVLQRIAPGVYEGETAPLAGETRRVLLQDAAGSWRLAGLLKGGLARLGVSGQ